MVISSYSHSGCEQVGVRAWLHVHWDSGVFMKVRRCCELPLILIEVELIQSTSIASRFEWIGHKHSGKQVGFLAATMSRPSM